MLFTFLFFTSCRAPIDTAATYSIEEFVLDAECLTQGQYPMSDREDQKNQECIAPQEISEDLLIEGDELALTLYCPQRPDHVKAIEAIQARIGFHIYQGKISLPHLSPIEVEGLTLREAKSKIQAAYHKNLPDSQIFIDFKKKRERFVQIIGAKYAKISVDGKMRLSEVLAQAQISPYANLFKSYVMRKGQKLPIDFYKLIYDGHTSQNLVMQEGDQIFIANKIDTHVIVMGEVLYPSIVPIPYGYLSLREALICSGSIPFTGNKKCIQVIRGDKTHPKIYQLNWKEMNHYPNQSLLLMPGDVIVITEKPITAWNRFISQLQPSTANMQTAYHTYQFFNSNSE